MKNDWIVWFASSIEIQRISNYGMNGYIFSSPTQTHSFFSFINTLLSFYYYLQFSLSSHFLSSFLFGLGPERKKRKWMSVWSEQTKWNEKEWKWKLIEEINLNWMDWSEMERRELKSCPFNEEFHSSINGWLVMVCFPISQLFSLLSLQFTFFLFFYSFIINQTKREGLLSAPLAKRAEGKEEKNGIN